MTPSSRARIAVVLAAACTALPLLAQPAPEPFRLPFEVGVLDSTRPAPDAPRMFATPEEIARARTRIAADPWAAAIFQRLVAEAHRHLAIEVKPIDERWWQAARTKPWEQTYPEVYLNTSVIPRQYSVPAVTLAMAWRLTGDARYADKAAALLMALAPYSFEADHFDVGMNYAGFGTDALRCLDLLAGRLTTGQRVQLDAFMTRLANAVGKNDVYWISRNVGGGINNHLAWHKMVFGLLGLYYSRPDMTDYCMSGRRGLVPLLVDGLVDDGLWCESSLTYQFAAIIPMVLLADCQQRMGVHPGIHELSMANGRGVKQAYDAMFNVLAPDTLIPPIGDAYGARARLTRNPLYEYCWNLYRDPRYAWLIRQNPEPTSGMLLAPPLPAAGATAAPPIGSVLLPEHGYAFLRSHRDREYWHNRQARCAFLTFDRSGVHANADKLSLMLFGLNRMMLSDVEGKATVPHAFSSRIQRELNRGGLSQNTVMIDGTDQRCMPDMLDLLEYRDVPDEKRCTAADRRGILYDGVRQMRTIAMTPDYVLDVFQVDCGGNTRQIDWIVHVMDEKATAPAEANPLLGRAEPFALPTTGAYPWLRAVRSAVPDGPVTAEWRDGGDRLALHMADLPCDRVITCGYPLDDRPESPSIPMLVVRRNAARATFAAVWLIGDTPKNAEVRALPDHDGHLAWEVTAGGRTRRHYVPRL